MAARRLIAILIVLMLVSTFAAALAPQRQESEDTTEATTTTAPTPPSGELVEAVIPARPEQPRVIDAAPGDQVSLVVRVADPQPVSIAALGLTSFATPGDPARFDILVRQRQPATIEVGEGGGREVVGRIQGRLSAERSG